jgi:hypothetical protein
VSCCSKSAIRFWPTLDDPLPPSRDDCAYGRRFRVLREEVQHRCCFCCRRLLGPHYYAPRTRLPCLLRPLYDFRYPSPKQMVEILFLVDKFRMTLCDGVGARHSIGACRTFANLRAIPITLAFRKEYRICVFHRSCLQHQAANAEAVLWEGQRVLISMLSEANNSNPLEESPLARHYRQYGYRSQTTVP